MSTHVRARKGRRPRSVVIDATLQLLTTVPFLLGTFVVLAYGGAAQAAAEAEIVRQGLPGGILAQHGVNFSGSDTLIMPGWLTAANIAKLALTTLGSLLVIALLAVPTARRVGGRVSTATVRCQGGWRW
ncbi:hypothetical protein [Nonomuraea insulae]|uniref:Uncharacterized protein n=1 Tax=Nonomuraea insulae TaxID=1616787 RepID=A0ABW1CCI5_9ACTN